MNLSFTLGYFAYNPTYAARPDNTGIAILRYAAHVDMFVPTAYLGLYMDTTFFSDKRAEHELRPTELDLTVGVALRLDPFELSIAFERDTPTRSRRLHAGDAVPVRVLGLHRLLDARSAEPKAGQQSRRGAEPRYVPALAPLAGQTRAARRLSARAIHVRWIRGTCCPQVVSVTSAWTAVRP